MDLKPPEKFAFLHLAHYLARIDGYFSQNEQEIIREYCIEMGIDDILFEPENFDLIHVLRHFKSSQSQHIVMLELMLLIYSDSEFNAQEHHTISKIATFFGIDNTILEDFSKWGEEANALYNKGKKIIHSPRQISLSSH
jgi:tellurite resistance protein